MASRLDIQFQINMSSSALDKLRRIMIRFITWCFMLCRQVIGFKGAHQKYFMGPLSSNLAAKGVLNQTLTDKNRNSDYNQNHHMPGYRLNLYNNK